MSVYIVTGKLGAGKTLAAVSRINEALRDGRKVATNLDLRLRFMPGLSRKNRSARVVRLPDRPLSSDLAALGFGIEGVRSDVEAKHSYEESRFGLIVLDECGTWLNAREWQDADRRQLLDLLLHIRKKLWHVYLIIQDISMLDKQVRKALAEHVVYCRNLANFRIPVVSFLSEQLLGKPIKFPHSHLAFVKYGDQPTSITIDRWFYGGSDMYRAYDTTQVFRQEIEPASYSILGPGYTWLWPKAKLTVRNLMRITQIYLKRTPKLLLAGWAALFGAIVSFVLFGRAHAPSVNGVEPAKVAGTVAPSLTSQINDSWFIKSYSSWAVDGEKVTNYTLSNDKGQSIDTVALTLSGIKYTGAGACRLIIEFPEGRKVLSCRVPDDGRNDAAPAAS